MPSSSTDDVDPQDEIAVLAGAFPGALDPTQPSRLLRPGSIISFASYDPSTARALQYPFEAVGRETRRVVVESFPDGKSTWRWVPSARKENGVDQEGTFSNRLVEICGVPYRISQEQWDIHKLDPYYDCCVRREPALPSISLRIHEEGVERHPRPSQAPFTQKNSPEPNNIPDQRPSSSDEGKSSTFANTQHTGTRDVDINDLPASYVDHMDIDEDNLSPEFSFRQQNTHPCHQEHTPPSKRFREHSPDGLFHFDLQAELEGDKRSTVFYTTRDRKRIRTLSPQSKHRRLNAGKSARAKTKLQRLDSQKDLHRKRYSSFTDEDNARKKGDHTTDTEPPPTRSARPEGVDADDDDLQASRLAESIQKLAHMNLNRPAEREREKVSEHGARCASPRKDAHAPSSNKGHTKNDSSPRACDTNQDEARTRSDYVEQRRRLDLIAKASAARAARNAQWDERSWNSDQALKRYKAQSLFFDAEKFSLEENPLTVNDIPWPTLTHPLKLVSEDLEYDAISRFLNVAKNRLSLPEFTTLVAKSRLRFHPDRWTNARRLGAIQRIEERDILFGAVNTVAKAMNNAYDGLR